MTDQRILFHKLLCEVLSCPIEGERCRYYFQPPEFIKMNYPAIVHSLDDVDKIYANDGVYLPSRGCVITVIDKGPDTSLVQKVASLPMSRFDRHFREDNPSHYTLNAYFQDWRSNSVGKFIWDKVGKRLYETGVDHSVLYPIQTGGQYNKGVAWNDLNAVTESPSRAESSSIYANSIRYLNLMSAEDLGETIKACASPNKFAGCDDFVEVVPGIFAGQQSRRQFGPSYRTILGNDVDPSDYGYELHPACNRLVSVPEKGYTTVSDNPEATAPSRESGMTPAETVKIVDGRKLKPTVVPILDSIKIDVRKSAALEEILYGKDPTTPEGNDGVDPRPPFPNEAIELLAAEDLP